MKITKKQLKKIIEEELAIVLETKRPRTPKETAAMRQRQDDEYLRRTGRGHEASDAPGVTSLSKADLRKLNKPKKIRKEDNVEETMDSGIDPERATAAGLEQDIEKRRKRGSFEKGDYGIHGDTGYTNRGGMAGEYSDWGEYPWVQDALESLRDAEYNNQVAALSHIAQELGISVIDSPED